MTKFHKVALLSENPRMKTKVYKIIYNKQYFVAKSIPKSLKRVYNNEILLNRKLNHTHIVKFHNCIVTTSKVYLLFEVADGGDLFDLIYKTNVQLDLRYVLYLFHQIVCVVRYMHQNDIVHMDLKPENVLLDKDKTYAYVGDFGLSIDLNKLDQYKSPLKIVGTKSYMSPEQYFHEVSDFKKIDIWCLGHLLFEMAFRRPMIDVTMYRTKEDIQLNLLNIFENNHYSKSIITLVSKCTMVDPSDRICIDELHKLVLLYMHNKHI